MPSRRRNRNIARQAAINAGINPGLFLKQMKQEAGFQTGLVSSAGAGGPAQIMPATADAWGVEDVNDPHEAYNAAATNMRKYLKSYGGSWAKALTAYNAGPGRVGGPLPSETQHYIATILGGRDDHKEQPGRKSYELSGSRGTVQPGKAPQLIPGGSVTDQKGAMLAALMDDRKDMGLLQRYREAVSTGNYTTTTPTTVAPGKSPKYIKGDQVTVGGGGSAGSGRLGRIKAEADLIDQAKVPYLWGGGHDRKHKRGSKVTPLDCSGAVSRLLGINPRVAAQFKTWGKAGRGKNFTIWAADDHVLVEIAGQFWGTSQANPGGGAGWIPRKQVSSSYLSRFTPRHF